MPIESQGGVHFINAADEAWQAWSLAADLGVLRTLRRSEEARVMTRHKPTFASVTTKPCTCNWPRDVSAEPENSIRFDEATGEYNFIMPSGGQLNIYHCPFCGGVMPRSKRAELFAYVSEAEVERLDKLTRKLQSVDEAVRVLGSPDRDMPSGLRVRTPAKGRHAPRVASYRVLTFTQLSDTADVELADWGPEGIRFSFRGKYLGKGTGPQNNRMQRTRSASARRRGPRR